MHELAGASPVLCQHQLATTQSQQSISIILILINIYFAITLSYRVCQHKPRRRKIENGGVWAGRIRSRARTFRHQYVGTANRIAAHVALHRYQPLNASIHGISQRLYRYMDLASRIEADPLSGPITYNSRATAATILLTHHQLHPYTQREYRSQSAFDNNISTGTTLSSQ
jgi:hypothetical protein